MDIAYPFEPGVHTVTHSYPISFWQSTRFLKGLYEVLHFFFCKKKKCRKTQELAHTHNVLLNF